MTELFFIKIGKNLRIHLPEKVIKFQMLSFYLISTVVCVTYGGAAQSVQEAHDVMKQLNLMSQKLEELQADKTNLKSEFELLKSSSEHHQADNEQLKSVVEDLKLENKGLRADIQDLQSNNQRLMSDNEQLRLQSKQLASENQEMKAVVNQMQLATKKQDEDQQLVNQELVANVDSLKAENQQVKAANEEFKVHFLKHDEEIADVTQAVFASEKSVPKICDKAHRNQPVDLADAVAFSAFVTHFNQVYLEGERIKFEEVEYDSGDFSTDNSSFTCPTTGLYYFNINIYFYMDWAPYGLGHAALIKESSAGTEQIMSVSSNTEEDADHHYDIVSNSIMTMCSTGDFVYVEAVFPSEVFGGEGRRTTFNGFLLAAE